jgi:hypothetical protein
MREAQVRQLQETARVHQEAAGADVLSVAALTRLNPDFVIHLAREMLEHAGSEPPPPGTLRFTSFTSTNLIALHALLALLASSSPRARDARARRLRAAAARHATLYYLLY